MTMSEAGQDLVAMLQEWLENEGLAPELVTMDPNEVTIIVEIDADHVAEWSMS